MDVGINEAGEDVFAGGIHDLHAGRRGDIAVDARDGFVSQKIVGDVAFVSRYDLFAIFYD